MITIKEAKVEDFAAILPLLQEMDGADAIAENEWRQLFKNHYGGPENFFGYAAFDQGRAVGFMGLIFSERSIKGRIRKIGNMSTWIVNKEYRGKGLGRLLLLELAKLVNSRDYTLTNLTPAQRTIPMLIECGYKVLETHCKIILPLPTIGMLYNKCSVEYNPGLSSSRLLNDDESKIYEDHKDFKCTHIFIRSGNEHCYLIITKTSRRNAALAEVHYISNFTIFMKHVSSICISICLRLKVFGLLIDERFLRSSIIKQAITVGTRKFYLSKSLDKNDLTDNLYTEIVIFLNNSRA